MAKQKKITDLPPPNARMLEVVNYCSGGNVADFVSKMDGVLHQSLNRLFNKDSRNNKYPGISGDIITAVIKSFPDIDTNWILTGKGSMLKTGLTGKGSNFKEEDPSAMQILSILAKTIDRHEANSEKHLTVFDKFADALKAHAETLSIIKKEMAQETTQAKIDKTVDRVEFNLNALLKKQEGGFGIVIELLKRDARREAKNNPDKAREILEEIVSRIGPDLSPKLKEDIRVDEHT